MPSILNPLEVMEQVEIKAGSVAADFGSGSGYFALELAKRVGDKGKVYAVDVLPTALESVRSLAKMRGFLNVETRWANLEKTSTLDNASCDFILAANVFFQVDAKFWPAIIKEITKVLKPGGQTLFIDWKKDSPLGPPKDQRVTEDKIKSLAGEQLKFVKKLDIGESHWGLLFHK
jgi:ubiquinone/menaquinone biosynthesis C-methylase UbiE